MPTRRSTAEAQPIVAELPAHPAPLHQHAPHVRHPVRNANELHAAEKRAKRERGGLRGLYSTFNQWLADKLAAGVGTMECAYLFAILAILGFPGFHATPAQYVAWLSQTFIQLVMLAVISMVDKIGGRKQELQAEESFKATMRDEHNTEEIIKHMNAQDAKMVRIEAIVLALAKASNITITESDEHALPPTAE